MNRLEEIKKTFEEYSKADRTFGIYDAPDFTDDIGYLLQELESLQYKYDKYRETALNRIRYDEDRMNTLLQHLEIAQKALEKSYEIDGYMFVRLALDQLKE